MTNPTYTISELASEFGITPRTIRFYEEKGLVTPAREGSRRVFSPADRVRIKLILRGRRIGLSLRECVDVIDLYEPGTDNREQLHSLLERVAQRRRKLLRQRADLDAMLAGLDDIQSVCETALQNNSPDSGIGNQQDRKQE